MGNSLLFTDGSSQDIDFRAVAASLGQDALLWVDLAHADEHEIAEAIDVLGIGDETRERLRSPAERADVHDQPTQLHVTVLAPGSRDEMIQVDCVAGELWLLTLHSGPVEAIAHFRDRVTGRGELGTLDAPTFLADLLEWVLGGYVRAFESIEDDLEATDVAAIRATDDEVDGWAEKLVQLRRQAGQLRRALGGHRQVFVALARPEFDAVSSEESAERFAELVLQLDRGLDLAATTRESVLGSFELLVARAGQRTNEIMKVLTLVSVLLLPSTALAGIMGMNFKVGLFEHAGYFWVTVAAMLVVATATLVGARARRWI